MILPGAKTEQTMLFPTLSPGSSAVKQENTRSIYRVILKIMAGGGGGGRFFWPGPKFFHFGPFFVMDDLDSSNSAWEWHLFSLGSARRQTKNSGSLQFFTEF